MSFSYKLKSETREILTATGITPRDFFDVERAIIMMMIMLIIITIINPWQYEIANRMRCCWKSGSFFPLRENWTKEKTTALLLLLFISVRDLREFFRSVSFLFLLVTWTLFFQAAEKFFSGLSYTELFVFFRTMVIFGNDKNSEKVTPIFDRFFT